jgi:sugar phosphate isomerase/epimerase
LDTANSLGCGETVDQVLDALADLVINVHIKEFSVRRLPHRLGFLVEGAPAGRGMLDIPALLRRLEATGRRMSAILEQWPPPEATLEASVAKEAEWAAESIRYLRTLLPAAPRAAREEWP